MDRLWSIDSQFKIIIISGHYIPSEEFANKAEVLQKPLPMRDLVSKVREALDR